MTISRESSRCSIAQYRKVPCTIIAAMYAYRRKGESELACREAVNGYGNNDLYNVYIYINIYKYILSVQHHDGRQRKNHDLCKRRQNTLVN